MQAPESDLLHNTTPSTPANSLHDVACLAMFIGIDVVGGLHPRTCATWRPLYSHKLYTAVKDEHGYNTSTEESVSLFAICFLPMRSYLLGLALRRVAAAARLLPLAATKPAAGWALVVVDVRLLRPSCFPTRVLPASLCCPCATNDQHTAGMLITNSMATKNDHMIDTAAVQPFVSLLGGWTRRRQASYSLA